jgi:hypothetical protein
MNKYLPLLLSFGLLVSVVLDSSAKSLPEKGEPTKPVAKRAKVAVPAQNVLEQQHSKFVKISIGEATQLAPLKRVCNRAVMGIFVRPFSMVLDIIIRQK